MTEDLSCTFELGTCGWHNDPAASAQWLRHRGSTPSDDTGPDGDAYTGGEK